MSKQTRNQQSKDVAKLFETIEEKSISFEEKRIKDLAQKHKMPYINLQKLAIEPDAITLIPKDQSHAGQIVCFYKKKGAVKVGTVDPHNKTAKNVIKELHNSYQCTVYLISEASFKHAVSLYPLIIKTRTGKKEREEIIRISEELIKKSKEKIESWPKIKNEIINKPIEELINTIIARALEARASDIHLEPKKNVILLRLRIDGIMHKIITFSVKTYPRILTRFKLTAGLKLNITDTPQDGRFTAYYNSEEIDIRISTLPTNYGEAINLRLLGLERDYLLKIENLGIQKNELQIIKKNLAKPSGMILLTGATGSGKTTTLYAFLNYKKDPEIKIMTLEDPIEYRLEGISQIQIYEKKGLTFAKGLRGVLRQDPDIIMVGEIRDPETAEITIRAATTGHIVFSTLHAGSTSEIVAQLQNMGADPQNLSNVLNLLINQKLVRQICEKCKEGYLASPEIAERIKKVIGNKYPVPDKLTIYKAKGCPACEGIGYEGRIGIFEIMNISKRIRQLIITRVTPEEIYKQALAEGMTTLIQDGLIKIIQGKTTLKELKRVT